ncbi:FAD-dependent monooxygenase [Actinokineospora globicatena]|uniref:FAD-dependent monooxygenase n=1 Tax=Actinokineospora globicatena TaxID=103729 RepID=UPI0020A25583|nr:FAD-dependent monooxygenase [Actinokineospora globicatena]MCP2306762.1 2-polyprenyl-6-methoxyphenol hydroxylase [Actinokineospora globicatena]GLW82119.1 hypothetical protein Aglo01_66000 [Actinokineospora globicatena]GLW88912.1 hypothetical protein Aglo02_65510 [Actinokineospora globicatena]
MAAPTRTPVVVVGGGPVGLVLALLLDHHGVACTVVNDGDGPTTTPRGSTHGARTMEHYRRLGLAEAVRRLGLPADHPTDVVYHTRYTGFELARLRMPSALDKRAAVRDAPATDQVPEPLHRANQRYVERLLFAAAGARPGITLRFGHRATGLAQDADGVTTHTDGGDLRSAYVVGCDGGQGVVRAALGVRYRGSGAVDQAILGRRAVAAHLRVPGLAAVFARAGAGWSHWSLNHEVVTNLISLDGAAEFFLLTSSTDRDGVPGLVRRAAGAPVRVDVLGTREWTPGQALVAERFSDRRVLLAGDAAHLFTPTGGFGMNTGVDDAANLAWKLAAAVAGWAGPGLVDSYAAERVPIAVRNTAAARALNKNLADVRPCTEMELDTESGRRERARIGHQLADFGEQFASIGVQLGARYDGSPIVAEDGTPPPDSAVDYTPSSVPGGRAPHAWLRAGHGPGDSLFDHFGPGFTLLLLGSTPHTGAGLRAAATALGVPLEVVEVPDPHVRDAYCRDLVLIRPDQHVAWRGNREPADPHAVLARAVGHGE